MFTFTEACRCTVAALTLLGTSLSFSCHANDIWLMRHAEKQSGANPSLTAAGQQRAQRIAELIAPSKPTAIFSTAYARTEQTAGPLAALTQLPVQHYDPSQLDAFAQQLKQLPGTIVVVGHSNTTPQLLQLLSGIERQLDEQTFDVLYHLVEHEHGYQLLELSSGPSTDAK